MSNDFQYRYYKREPQVEMKIIIHDIKEYGLVNVLLGGLSKFLLRFR